MGKQRILLIDPNSTTQYSVAKYLSKYSVEVAVDAESAVGMAAESTPDLIILEMSLSGHSGMEFLYEFRTYEDWLRIPVVVYSSINISEDVLRARAWSKLDIHEYLYKPESSLAKLEDSIEKALVATT